ncbi:MAG TPA: exodeoxyribonuclease VII large subunit, partial [Candidatus Krumholzibacteria bacterium]|nr:exodeoxyribonuclease VII large subunit [Candidatus Krumholzibacteria bacterium]
PLPLVPARIGLITSVGSAAYNDFINELEQGGFGHRVVVVDARVQGAEAERTLLAALGTLKRHELDLVAIVRGGGSQSDLAAFDSEALARAICKMPIPVLTGIGHEIDTSVADHVAHTAYKTPTACAAALVTMAANFLSLLQERAEEIASLAEKRTANERQRLIMAAQLASSRAKARIVSAQRDLLEAERSLLRETPRALSRAESRRERIAGELRGTGRLVLHRADQTLQAALGKLTLSRMKALLNRRAEKLSAQETRVRLLDPRRVLARGYSISRGPKGAVVRRATELKVGDRITTQLSQGSVSSEVKECRKERTSS